MLHAAYCLTYLYFSHGPYPCAPDAITNCAALGSPSPRLPLSALLGQGVQGTTVTLTARLDQPWATSLGVSYSQAAGPILKYEADVGPTGRKVKGRVDVRAKTRDIKLELVPRPIDK